MELPHRDDVPMDVAEALVAKMKAEHPGCKVVFAGDLPADQVPPEIREATARMGRAQAKSVLHGACLMCGARMADYRIEDDDWNPPTGWGLIYGLNDEPLAWECPACGRGDEPTEADHADAS
jgi:hypothetical protein